MVHLQRIEVSQADALSRLARTAYEAQWRGIDPDESVDRALTEELSPKQCALDLADPRNHFIFVYEHDPASDASVEPIGYAKLVNDPPEVPPEVPRSAGQPTARVHRMYFLPHLKGRGYGKILLRECLRIAKEEWRVAHAWLGVYPKNERAKALYTSFGFTKVGTIDYHGDTDNLMWLEL